MTSFSLNRLLKNDTSDAIKQDGRINQKGSEWAKNHSEEEEKDDVK
jgi:hypothetical protein